MRAALILIALAILAGCEKPQAKPRKAQAKPVATMPVPPRAPATPQPVASWKVVSVHDGDTLRAIDQTNHEIKVRLHGIDAPEVGQAFGSVARDALAKLVKGKAVQLDVMDTDRYGRTVARVIVGGIDANVQMVADGMAWHYRKYSDDPKLDAAEQAARAAKRGLWADAKPVAPWEWRATEKAPQSGSTREAAGP